MANEDAAPVAPTPLFELQAQAGRNYFTLLQEINALGIEGFFALLDGCTEEELHALLGACDTVYQKVQSFKATRPAQAPKVGG